MLWDIFIVCQPLTCPLGNKRDDLAAVHHCTEHLYRALLLHVSELAALKAYLKVRIEDGSGILFTGQKGALKRWTLTQMFRSYCEEVSKARVERGLAPIAENAMHFHSIKHTIATILASRVDNIFIVKTLLGHSAISSTKQYCHPDQKAAARPRIVFVPSHLVRKASAATVNRRVASSNLARGANLPL